MSEPLVEIDDLRVWFKVTSGVVLDRHVGDVKAVDGVTFSIETRRDLGLVGESGCGKSTLGRAILRLYNPTGGRVVFDGPGHHERIRERAPSGPPEDADGLPGSVRVAQPAAVGRAHRRRAAAHARHRLAAGTSAASVTRAARASSACPPTRRTGIRTSSRAGSASGSGSPARSRSSPDFVVCDEPVSALDVSIQAQIVNLLEDLQREFHLTYLFIAHDLAVVRHISTRSPSCTSARSSRSRRPTTCTRTRSIRTRHAPLGDPDPRPGGRAEPARDPPRRRSAEPGDPPHACRFHTRCPFVQPRAAPTRSRSSAR